MDSVLDSALPPVTGDANAVADTEIDVVVTGNSENDASLPAQADLEPLTTATITNEASQNNISIPEAEPNKEPKTPVNPGKKKRGKKKAPQSPPKPAGLVGMADDMDGFRDARLALNHRIPWFRENPISNFAIKHVQVPPDINWDDGKSIHNCFPPWKLQNGRLLGTRQVPRCFILDAKSDIEKLLIVNWWKAMSKDQQTDVASKENIHRFYRAPMRSNSPYKFWHDVPEEKGSRFLRPDASADGSTNGTNSASDYPREHNNMEGAPIVLKKEGKLPRPGFRQAQCCLDIARRFNLSLDKLYCARLEDSECTVETCHYPAFSQNRNLCCVHKQNWWPRTGLEHHQKRRGHLLLGVEYAVRPTKDDIPTNKSKVRPMSCGCSDATCEGIGWSADMARIPKGYTLPEVIVPNVHRDKDRPLRLAPWHFPPKYRLQLPDGTWKMLLDDKTAENFPDPIYDPKDFLKETGMVEYQNRKSPFLLPDWVHVLRAVEEGPDSLEEYQRKVLIGQRDNLVRRLLWQSVEHQELSHEHHLAENKIEEMKKTHIHKRNLKRIADNKASGVKKGGKRGRVYEDYLQKRQRANAGDMMGFRPVNDMSEGEMSDHGEMEVHRQQQAQGIPTRLQDTIQQYRDETVALHEGAQAIHYLQHQPPHLHHHHPHAHLHQPPPQQAAQAHNVLPIHHPQYHPTSQAPGQAQLATAPSQLHQGIPGAPGTAPPMQAGPPDAQQQGQPPTHPPHNSAFYTVGTDPMDLNNTMGRAPQQNDLSGLRRWGTFGGYR